MTNSTQLDPAMPVASVVVVAPALILERMFS